MMPHKGFLFSLSLKGSKLLPQQRLTMMRKRIATTVVGLAAAGGAVLAGEGTSLDGGGGDWCRLLTDDLGAPLYSNDDAMLIQAMKFFGRAQVQFASVDVDGIGGVDDSETFDEVRRLRLGTQLQVLQHFKVKVNANLVSDGKPNGGSRDYGYQSLDVALVSFDAGALLGGGALDGVNVSVGRHKVGMSYEVHTSSKKIKTVERSAVANKVYPARLTGITAKKAMGNFSGTIGAFSTESTPELASDTGGLALYASGALDLGNGDKLIADFLHNDAYGTADNEVGLYDWALALAYLTERNGWDLLLQGTIGDNGDDGQGQRGGDFWGFVAMASRDLIADKLEAVVRYSAQGSDEAEGIRSNSRYFRRSKHTANVNSGRGDAHQSIYAGLNYFVCGHNAKIMTGVEWESLEAPAGDADALTLWLAFRTYF